MLPADSSNTSWPRTTMPTQSGNIRPGREEQKEALYLAAKLALDLKDFETAETHAHALAALDFGYKDLAALLDKIAQSRQD